MIDGMILIFNFMYTKKVPKVGKWSDKEKIRYSYEKSQNLEYIIRMSYSSIYHIYAYIYNQPT